MNFVTCGQMKVLEKRADEAGLSYYQMMENAGTGTFKIIEDYYPEKLSQTKSLVFCGKGNNGGDGFVVGRKLREAGSNVTVILVDGEPKSPDATTNFQLLSNLDIHIIDMTKTNTPFMELKGRPHIIVDAIYGTGFHGKLNNNALKASAFINQFYDKAMIVALDIPSGLGGDTLLEEQVDINGVKAHITATFHNKKPVHIKAFSKKYCGQVIIVDIGINEEELW